MSIRLSSNVSKFKSIRGKIRCMLINFKTMYIFDHKGNWLWEWQIGPIVIMWQHDPKYIVRRGIHVGRLILWRDTAWVLGSRLKYFLRRIKKYVS